MSLSIILPAYNEGSAIAPVVRELCDLYPKAEVLVVDDGSSDDTAAQARAAGATVIAHPYNKGNGASVRTGIRAATGEIVLMMDADGQHRPEDIAKLLACFPTYDMVVGARDRKGQAGWHRGLANRLYNGFASWLTRFPIDDLTSGFRAFKRSMIFPYLHLFPQGFSYPTTSTMAMLKAGANVCYVPIQVQKRIGKSKIKLLRDGSRFFLIMLKLVTLFSPMRIFLPISLLFAILGFSWSAYTLSQHHFTNMAAMLIIISLLVFLMGLIAEQLSAIHTQDK